MTITEFLLARIAEDESAAQAAKGDAEMQHFGATAADALLGLAESEGAQEVALQHFLRHDPARVLAECEAKRAIAELSIEAAAEARRGRADTSRGAAWGLTDAVQLLALPYADHPDFRDEWRP